VLVEVVAEVRHRALAHGGDEGGGGVRAESLHEVEAEDHEGHVPDVDALDEDLVEDRLDLGDEDRPRRGVAGGHEPREHEPPSIGPRVGEEPEELRRFGSRGDAERAELRRPGARLTGRGGALDALDGDRGKRYGA
jgi:hypothetical protein